MSCGLDTVSRLSRHGEFVISISRSWSLARPASSRLSTAALAVVFLAAVFLAACSSTHAGVNPGSSATASPSIEASATQSLTFPDLKFKVADAEGPVRVCGPPVVRAGGDQAEADAGFPLVDAATYAAILRHEHLTANPTSPSFRLAVYRAYKAIQTITLNSDGGSYRFEIPTTKQTIVSGTIDHSGTITGVSSRPLVGGCPICLTAGTTISTPDGPIPVNQLRVGMPIWTLGPDGGRQLARVRAIGQRPMPLGHDA